MKRILAVLMIAVMIFCLSACGSEKTEIAENTGGSAVGGWTMADSHDITDEQAAIFEKALEGLTGAKYEAVAYIASQLVSGTNHLFLVRVSPVIPDPVEKYALARVYEDLSGNVRLEEVIETDIETNINGSLGGWQIAESTEVPDDVKAVISDSGLVPVAVSATQVVSGTNYCVFCQSDPSAPDLKDMFCVAYVYKDLKGNAEITDTVNFGINE